MRFFKKWILLFILLSLLLIFFIFGWNNYLNFQSLKVNSHLLLSWANNNYGFVVITFILIYIVATAISVPGAIFLTLLGGFLFGPLFGSILVILSATIGASLVFFAFSMSIGEKLSMSVNPWVSRMRLGFKKHAFSYLLVLRLIPIFPFWVVNIVPALLNVGFKTYIGATFLGIIPGSIIYVFVGNGLKYIVATDKTPNLKIIFEPMVFLPLLGLALLSLIPMLYKMFFERRDESGRKFEK